MVYMWNVPLGVCVVNANDVASAINVAVEIKRQNLTDEFTLLYGEPNIIYINNVCDRLRYSLSNSTPIIIPENHALFL